MEPSVEQLMEYLIQWWNGRNRHAPRHLFLESLVDELRRVELAAIEARELAKEAADLGHVAETMFGQGQGQGIYASPPWLVEKAEQMSEQHDRSDADANA